MVSCPMITWRDPAAEYRLFPALLFVGAVLEEKMQTLKLIAIHPRRYRSQGAVFLLDLLQMDPTRPIFTCTQAKDYPWYQ